MVLIISGAYCRCSACERQFGNVAAFDAHRAGPYGHRRCLTIREQIAADFRVDAGGVWWKPSRAEVAAVSV